MRTSRIALVLIFLASIATAADSGLPLLFAKAKSEFQKSQYKESLANFDELERRSQERGNEADRKQLDPVITFYRAANLAALGRKDEAAAAFISYLSLVPQAQLDAKMYPKAVSDAFVAARKDVGLGVDSSLTTELADFHPAPGETIVSDEHWAESPVRYLLTREEKKAWSTLANDTQRSAFVDKFWSNLDPTPGDADNPIRREFERRLLFARTKFAAGGKPGASSDRAAVFVLLGPPSYVGRARLSSGDTEMDAMRGGVSNSPIAAAGHTANNLAGVSGPGTNDGLMTDLQRGMREAWYYRKGRLASAMRYAELRVDFVTREGYGTGVMQREPEILQALGQAASLMRKTGGLN